MTLEQLKQFTQDYFDVDITEKTRKVEIIKIRYLFYYYAYNYIPEYLTYQAIGNAVGFNHATVIHGIKEFPNFMLLDTKFKNEVNHFEKVLFKFMDNKKDKVKVNINKVDFIKRRISFYQQQLKQLQQ